MISVPVDPAPETYGDEVEHRALLSRHARSISDTLGTQPTILYADIVALNQNGTYTDFSIAGVHNDDHVALVCPAGVKFDFAATCLINGVRVFHDIFTSGSRSVYLVVMEKKS
tara:strand:- start:642 stop:980 length:339 start_codon:yes stop_codon:yes gene_type:complete